MHKVRFQRLIEPTVLLLVLLLSLAAGAFVWTVDEMREGETMLRDRQWLLALHVPNHAEHLVGGAAALQLAREVTALGSPWFLCLLVGAVVGLLMTMGQLRLATYILLSTSAGALFNSALKLGFHRARPDLVPHEAMVMSASFPSGHAFGAAMVYLTLAALLTIRLEPRAARLLVLAMAVGVTLAVGLSRVALGVHWPSDVLAGWTAGAFWALSTWVIAHATGWFAGQRRHGLPA